MKIIALKVSYNNEICGYLAKSTGSSGGMVYLFKYDDDYINKKYSRQISISLPIQREPFYSEKLFGFFDNLVSEGWLKREQAKLLDINESDVFSLLLKNGADTSGAVTVIHDEELSHLLKPYFK